MTARAFRLLAFVALGAGGAVPLQAQTATGDGPTPSPPAAAATSWDATPDSLRTALERLRERGDLGAIGRIDHVLAGPARLEVGDTISGSLVVHGGSLELDGVVRGAVAVVGGDLIIGDAAAIDGSASAVGGTVRVSGGRVGGDIRSSSSDAGALLGARDALDPRTVEIVEGSTAEATWRAVRLVLATFAMFLILGVGLLVFSQPTFDAVVRALEERFARAFWLGLAAQFAILPVLLLLVTALAISLIGILLIPFAVVAYAIAVVGLLALGFLAAARMTGGVFTAAGDASRTVSLRALLLGLAVYCGLWLLAASLSWHPLAGTAVRSVALAATWVAMTVGLGAIMTAGLAARRARADARFPRPQADPMAWQTPTPITGVVAARRTVTPTREAS